MLARTFWIAVACLGFSALHPARAEFGGGPDVRAHQGSPNFNSIGQRGARYTLAGIPAAGNVEYWSSPTAKALLNGTGLVIQNGASPPTNASTQTCTNGVFTSLSNTFVAVCSNTPQLGLAGTTVGTLAFANATSGTVTLSPVTGALGAVTISLPAATGTAMVATRSPTVSTTAVTLASGGCTGAAMSSAGTLNGTARFQAAVGTGCSGSQPLVFTLPAATNGWNCQAQDSSTAASHSPAQSSAISTTSVTITDYSRTTGLAQAWLDNDIVVVSCWGG